MVEVRALTKQNPVLFNDARANLLAEAAEKLVRSKLSAVEKIFEEVKSIADEVASDSNSDILSVIFAVEDYLREKLTLLFAGEAKVDVYVDYERANDVLPVYRLKMIAHVCVSDGFNTGCAKVKTEHIVKF